MTIRPTMRVHQRDGEGLLQHNVYGIPTIFVKQAHNCCNFPVCRCRLDDFDQVVSKMVVLAYHVG